MSAPHDPSVRPRPESYRLVDDVWRFTESDVPDAWEVVCTACGDDTGPIGNQAVEVRARRGPYLTQSEAAAAAAAHHQAPKAPPAARARRQRVAAGAGQTPATPETGDPGAPPPGDAKGFA